MQSPTPSPPDTDEERELRDDDEVFPLTRKTIREICYGKDPQSLPEDVRNIAGMVGAQGRAEVSSQPTMEWQHERQGDGVTPDPKGKAVLEVEGSQSSPAVENQRGWSPANPAKGSLLLRRQGAGGIRRINPIFVRPLGERVGQKGTKKTQQATQSEGNATENQSNVRILPRGCHLRGGTPPHVNPQWPNTIVHATVQGSSQRSDHAALETVEAREGGTSQVSAERTRDGERRMASPTGSAGSRGSLDPFTSLADLKKAARAKRKNKAQSSASTGPSKRQLLQAQTLTNAPRKGRGNSGQGENSGQGMINRTTCELGSSDFLQVSVPYELCTDIANIIGVSREEIMRTVEDDNEERARQPLSEPVIEVEDESEEEGEED